MKYVWIVKTLNRRLVIRYICDKTIFGIVEEASLVQLGKHFFLEVLGSLCWRSQVDGVRKQEGLADQIISPDRRRAENKNKIQKSGCNCIESQRNIQLLSAKHKNTEIQRKLEEQLVMVVVRAFCPTVSGKARGGRHRHHCFFPSTACHCKYCKHKYKYKYT